MLIITIFLNFKIKATTYMGTYLFVLDAGHGGKDPGTISGSIYEKDINLQIVFYLKEELERLGARVILTRDGDYDLATPNAHRRKKSDFDHRISLINNSKADYYLSIHLNYLDDSSYYGPQVFYSTVNDKNKDIALKLQKELNYNNIIIKNDGKCAAIAEKKYGSMKEFDDCVFLCLGTGIGGAAFLDSKLLKPKKHSGFEIGHMIIEKDGKLCKCGNRGCFETYCSMKRLKEKINREINKEHMESRDLLIFLKENSENEKIKEIIKEYIENLNIGLSNIINLLEPQCITLGGGFVHFKDILWNDLELEFKKAKYLFNKEDIPVIKLAELGNDAGIIGASIDINKK